MKYVAFLDESGDHSLTSIDPDNPWFVLGICVFDFEYYFSTAISQLNLFKSKYWKSEGVVLHAYEIRKSKGSFAFLYDQSIRQEFMQAISQLLSELNMQIFVAAIDKKKLTQQYTRPQNPYDLALKFLLERISLEYNQLEDLALIAESRGHAEDNDLRATFQKIRSVGSEYISGSNFKKLSIELFFEKKQGNIAGLQFVDLAISPIASKLRNPDKENLAYSVILPKLRKDSFGKSLKIFP